MRRARITHTHYTCERMSSSPHIGGMRRAVSHKQPVSLADLLSAATPARLAAACRVPYQTAWEWTRGIRRVPPAHLDAVAAVIGADPAALHREAARREGYRV